MSIFAKLGGLEILRLIRNRDGHLMIVMLTCSRDEQLDAFSCGASDVLDKPVDDLLLLARIKRLLEMRQQQCAQENFLSFLAHDMMQPLGVISATNDWLGRRPEVTAEAKDAFLDIDTAWKKLKTMIEDMLALSKLAQVDMAMEPESINLSEFLEQLEATHAGPLARNGLVFTSTYETDAALTLDPKLLGRLAGNIVGNARRFARRNILVSAREVGGFVELNFCNDGPAIPIDCRASVFEKFTQLTNGRGTLGLGLHFCKLVAELHGGSISVGQTEEWPVVFTVTLPKAIVRRAEETRHPATQASHSLLL